MSLHTGKVTDPRWSSAPYRQHPSRREHIHGRIQPMASPRRVPLWALLLVTFIIAYMGAHFISGAAQ
jgi:hypothetical protein